MKRALPLLLLASLAGCGAAQPSDSAFAKGVKALEEGQPRTARIEFLNAIRANPKSPAPRVMQARTYIELGDGVAAEDELARARNLGANFANIAHFVAHALILQDRPQDALAALAESAPAHRAYAARMTGRAQAMLGDLEAAEAAFEEALALAGNDSETWTELARYRRSTGELGQALQAADKAVALDPANVEALTLRGELTRGQYGLKAALPWFDRALEIDPDNVPALLERAATLADMGDMGAMLADTRQVLSLHRDHPMAYYLQAALAARAHNFTLARSLYTRTAGRLDGQPAVMLLASILDYQAGNFEQATRRLSQLVGMQPDNRKARRLLAAAQWHRGDAQATIRTLEPLANRADADTYSLTLMGKALHKLGDGSHAAIYFARAAAAQGESSTTPLEPWISEAELAALRNAASRGGPDAQIRLVRGLLSAGLGDEALARARELQAAYPGAPDAHVLVGDAFSLGGNFRAAAEQYRRAANIAFTEPVAMRMIEALDRSGQANAAGRVLALFLEQNPRNVAAQLLAAGRFMLARQFPQAISIYEGLRWRLGDQDAAMLNNLALAYAEQGNYAAAIPLARKAWALDRNNPATTDTLGWLLFKSGANRAYGLALLERAARGAPTDAQIREHLDAARAG